MKYRKPRSFNSVTVLLLLFAGLAVYLLIYLWPVYSMSSKVKSHLLDAIPTLYRANLLPSESAIPMIDRMKIDLMDKMVGLGLDPKQVTLTITRDAKEISLQAEFKAKAHFPYPDRSFEFTLSPRAVSDATRVEW